MVKKKLAEFFCADQLGQFLKFGCLILFLVLVGRFVSLVAHHQSPVGLLGWFALFISLVGLFILFGQNAWSLDLIRHFVFDWFAMLVWSLLKVVCFLSLFSESVF